jgi:hypothetical protein
MRSVRSAQRAPAGGFEIGERGDEIRGAGADGEIRAVDAAELPMDRDRYGPALLRVGDVDQRVAGGGHFRHAAAEQDQQVASLISLASAGLMPMPTSPA